jgi:hypothetical protein
MSEQADELSGVRDLSETLDAAIEMLALFLKSAADTSIPTEAMVDAAHQVVGDLAQWRATLQEISDRDETSGEGVH